MSYNGIGLPTARGTGTNGFIQANLANVFMPKQRSAYLTEEDIKKAEAEINRKPNKELLDHEKKRRVELKCLELNDLMEDQGYKQDEIDEKVNEYRTLLLDQVIKGEFELDLDRNGRPIANDSHTRAEIMAERKSRMRSALGIKDDFVEGSCLDQLKPKTEIAKAEIVKEEKPEDKKKWDERYEHDNRTKTVDSVAAAEEEVADKRLQLIDKVEKTTEKKTIKKEGGRKKEKVPPKKRARHASTSSDDSSSSSTSTDSDDSSDSSESSSSSDDDRKKKKKTTTTNKGQQRRSPSSPSHKDRRRITSARKRPIAYERRQYGRIAAAPDSPFIRQTLRGHHR